VVITYYIPILHSFFFSPPLPRPPSPPLFPYTTLFRSDAANVLATELAERCGFPEDAELLRDRIEHARIAARDAAVTEEISYLDRSEEHTSELQSLRHLVCRLLLEKKK